MTPRSQCPGFLLIDPLNSVRKLLAMSTKSLFSRSLVAICMGVSILFVAACSTSDGLGTRYKVSGRVTYKGQPVAKGVINFSPEKPGEGRGAAGTIDNGSYSLTTLTPGDGAFPGTYFVSINTREMDESAAKAATSEIASKKGMPGGINQIPPELQAKFRAEAKGTTPMKYEAQTDLKATVSGSTNSMDFDLKD